MKTLFSIIAIVFFGLQGCTQNAPKSSKMESKTSNAKYNPLTPEEAAVILNKGTERAFTGKYTDFSGKGTYVCKQCNAPLYRSSDKFKSECGWPSFDDEIPGAVKRIPDADGMRTEIVCANCGAHLGHVFLGEGLTAKDTRHCVNSISLNFIPESSLKAVADTAIFAGGCFWGVEYYMYQSPGVISTEVGYIGGHGEKPTYQKVCSHKTGYAEADHGRKELLLRAPHYVRVKLDPNLHARDALSNESSPPRQGSGSLRRLDTHPRSATDG